MLFLHLYQSDASDMDVGPFPDKDEARQFLEKAGFRKGRHEIWEKLTINGDTTRVISKELIPPTRAINSRLIVGPSDLKFDSLRES